MTPPHPAAPPRGKIYLQFEAWNENTNVFETLPQGVPVKLMHYNAVLSNDVLDTQNTDAQGRVEFPTEFLASKNKGNPPNIFYLAQTKGITIGGQKLPDEWSTKGWKARDGQPGYWKEFVGNRLGDVGSPHVFRIGLDFHIRWTYQRPGTADEAATKDIPGAIHIGSREKLLKTDSKGEMHGVVFDVSPGGETIWFHIKFEIEDSSINLPKTFVATDGGHYWHTNRSDDDQVYITNYQELSLGSKANPRIIRATLKERNVAFYFLKIVREWATFLYHITDHAWTGVKGLLISTTCISGPSNAFSWPLGEVSIGSKHHWDRGTLVHELSHQVMWKEANISSAGIVGQVIKCNLALIHYESLLSNTVHALIEGWAEFIEAIFDRSIPYSVADVVDGSGNIVGPLGPPPFNRGESVEGAFANGLWEMFRNYVVGTSGRVPLAETPNGDLSGITSWIDRGVKDRFKAMIWDPLKDLPFQPSKDTPAFIAKMRSMHPGGWHALSGNLHKYNLAMVPPSITGVQPAAGPVGGGQEVTITGMNFVMGMVVKIRGVSVPANVENSISLKLTTPPGTAGDAELEVTTPSGSDKRVYRYLT